MKLSEKKKEEIRRVYQHMINDNYFFIPLRGKSPYWDDWPKKGTQNIELIIEWLENGDNVGINLGKSWLCCIDTDGPDGEEYIQSIQGPENTRIHKTLGGYHRFYKVRPQEVEGNIKIIDEVDILSTGRVAVAPFSVHPDDPSFTYSVVELNFTKIIPKWFLLFLKDFYADKNGIKDNIVPKDKPRDKILSDPTNWKDGAGIKLGDRNETLFKIGCSLRSKGYSNQQIEDELLKRNRRLCSVPLPMKEIETIAVSCCNYKQGAKSLFKDVPEMDITIPNKMMKYFIENYKPAESKKYILLYLALSEITALNDGAPIYAYSKFIVKHYKFNKNKIVELLREFEKLGLVTIVERDNKGEYVSRELIFHPEKRIAIAQQMKGL